MEQITVKQAYFYTVSFILLMMMLYSLNGLVWQVIWHSGTSTSYSGAVDYEDAKGQLLWEKYGVTENTTVAPQEVQAFVKEQREKNRQFQIYSWYQGAARNMISLVVCFPCFGTTGK